MASKKIASSYDALFGRGRTLIGVVHLAPLPGSPRASESLSRIRESAIADARAYFDHGADAVIVENFGDAPFHRDIAEEQVVAAMAVIGSDLKSLAKGKPVGVNVLRNAALSALAVAVGAELDFLRVNVLTGAAVTDQGIIEGRAAELLRRRRMLESDCRILADLRVKHATPMRTEDVAVEVEELLDRALVDAILVTGKTTGRAPGHEWLDAVAACSKGAPVLVASGATADNLRSFTAARGFVVGTALKQGGEISRPVDPRRVARFRSAMDARS